MKITAVHCKMVEVPFKNVFRTSRREVKTAKSLIVRIDLDDGPSGYGEASSAPYVTGETPEGMQVMIGILGAAIIGENPLDLERIHYIMDEKARFNPSAKCAIDLALHDIRGRIAKQPVFRLLGGFTNVVGNDLTVSVTDPEVMAQTAVGYVERGFHTLKIKAGIRLEDDMRAIKLIRKAVGPDIHLKVDANQGYSVDQAMHALKGFSEAGVESIEQPLRAWDLEGCAFLHRAFPQMPLILDEAILTAPDAVRAVRLGAGSMINIKLMKCGGLYQAEKVNAVAESAGLPCMIGCMMETRLANAAGLAFAAAKRNVIEVDCDSFHSFEESGFDQIQGGFTFKGDVFTLSEEPGFGITPEKVFA